MPLTICPNCSTPMSEVARRGVYVDVCPSCRGVWLDGGELEKLLATADASAPAAAAPPPVPQQSKRYVSRDDYRRDYEDDDDRFGRSRGRRKGGMMDILGDLFD